jgi:hypothetical protein
MRLDRHGNEPPAVARTSPPPSRRLPRPNQQQTLTRQTSTQAVQAAASPRERAGNDPELVAALNLGGHTDIDRR